LNDDLDDLTLMYMYGFKNGKDSLKDEINKLRAALVEIVEECRNTGYGDPIVMERMIDRIEETACTALEGEKKDD